MYKLILTVLMIMFIVNIQAQGLGMLRSEIYEARIGDNHTDGVYAQSGLYYTTYDCDADQACLTTTYVYQNDVVIMVMDVFPIDILEETSDYLDTEFHTVKSFKWNDYKSQNVIDMRVDAEYKQFVLFYSKLD